MDLALTLAEAGIPIRFYPMPILGATAPVTVAGAAVVNNAEMVSAPPWCSSHTPAPRSSTAAGRRPCTWTRAPTRATRPTPLLLRAIQGHMADFYGMPAWFGAGATTAKEPGVQSAYENTLAMMTAYAERRRLSPSAPACSTARASSRLEQIVIDNEIFGMVKRILRGVEVSDETLAVDLIMKMGFNGNYLFDHHTRRTCASSGSRARRDRHLRRLGAGRRQEHVERAQESVAEILAARCPAPFPRTSDASSTLIAAAARGGRGELDTSADAGRCARAGHWPARALSRYHRARCAQRSQRRALRSAKRVSRKDADKLIRRLSLVAFLLCRRGQPATPQEIRRARRGLPADDRRRLQAPLLRGPRRARRAGHRDQARLRRRGRRRRALLTAGRALLPAAHRAHGRRALRAGGLPLRARGPLRLLAAAAPGPAQPRARAPRAARRGGRAAARGRCPSRRRARRRPAPQAAAAVAERKTVVFDYYAIEPRRGADADRRPLQPAARRRRVVSARLLPPARGGAHLPPLAHPLAGAPRDARAARLRAAVAFELADYLDRAPWQLGGVLGEASVRVDAAWPGGSRPTSPALRRPRAPGRRRHPLRDRRTAPPRSSSSWVLGLGEAAELQAPRRAARAAAGTAAAPAPAP